MKKFLLVALVGAVCIGTHAHGQTDVHPYLTDKFVIYAGGFFPKLNFVAQIDGSIGGENIAIDFEEEFNLPTSDEIFNGELNWRYHENWSLRTQYFNGGRNNTATLERDIEWGDEVFPIGTSATATTDMEIIRLFFGRKLESRDNVDGGIGLGVHHLNVGAAIQGTIIIDGTPFTGQKRRVAESAILPNIGAWYSVSWHEDWAFTSRIDWLEASIGDVRGSIINLSAGFNYQMFSNFGVGLSYQDFTLRLRLNEDFWRGRLKLSYRGAFAYFTVNW